MTPHINVLVLVKYSQDEIEHCSRLDVTVCSNVKTDLVTATCDMKYTFPNSWGSSNPVIMIQTQGGVDDTSIVGSDEEDNYITVPVMS